MLLFVIVGLGITCLSFIVYKVYRRIYASRSQEIRERTLTDPLVTVIVDG